MEEGSIDRVRTQVHREEVVGVGWCFTRPSRLRGIGSCGEEVESAQMILTEKYGEVKVGCGPL